jgi:hypothetical protein
VVSPWRERVRRIGGVLGIVAFAYGAVVVVLSLVPARPLAGAGVLAALPAFFAVFPVMGAAMVDTIGRGLSSARDGVPLALFGWRRWAAGVLGVLAMASFVVSVDGGPGTVERDGDRYVRRAQRTGRLTEISRDEWARAQVGDARAMASIALLFLGLGVLILTGDEPEADGSLPAVPRRPRTSGGRLVERVTGLAAVAAEGPGSPFELAERVRTVVPLTGRWVSPTDVAVHAAVDLRRSRISHPFPLRLDGRIHEAGPGRAALQATVRPVGAYGPHATVAGALVGVPFAAVAVAAAVQVGAQLVTFVFGIWALMILGGTVHSTWRGRRAVRKVAARVGAAAEDR